MMQITVVEISIACVPLKRGLGAINHTVNESYLRQDCRSGVTDEKLGSLWSIPFNDD